MMSGLPKVLPQASKIRKSAKRKLLEKINVFQASGNQPYFRVKSSVEVTDTQKLFLYGGFDEDDNLDTNIYLLDLIANKWDTKPNHVSREGHTTNYIGNDNIVVFGGVPDDELLNDSNESTTGNISNNDGASISKNLQKSQILIYNIPSNTWLIPHQVNPHQAPAARSRHATCLSKDRSKLFISGGFNASTNDLYDDLYCFDLSTGTWDGPRKFVKRFDHHLTFYNDKIWAFGGLDKNMIYLNSNEINYFDLSSNVTGKIEIYNLPKLIGDHVYLPVSSASSASSLSSLSHVTSVFAKTQSPIILDVIIPLWNSYNHNNDSNNNGYEISTPCISLLDINELKWKKLLFGNFEPLNKFVWRHTFINDNYLYMLGYPLTSDINLTSFDYKLTNLVKIDLVQLGLKNQLFEEQNNMNKLTNILLNNKLSQFGCNTDYFEAQYNNEILSITPDREISIDLAKFLDNEEFTDFQIIGVEGKSRPPVSNETVYLEHDQAEIYSKLSKAEKSYTYLKSKPINVHLAILLARWPYFKKVILSGMSETETKKLFIQEPITWIRSLVQYLYTGSLVAISDSDLYGLFILSHYYEIHSLFEKTFMILNSKTLNIKNAIKFYATCLQIDDCYVLKKKSLEFIFNNWGRVVRSKYFHQLTKFEILKLCQEVNESSMITSRSKYNKLCTNNDFNITNAIDDSNGRSNHLRYISNNGSSRDHGVNPNDRSTIENAGYYYYHQHQYPSNNEAFSNARLQANKDLLNYGYDTGNLFKANHELLFGRNQTASDFIAANNHSQAHGAVDFSSNTQLPADEIAERGTTGAEAAVGGVFRPLGNDNFVAEFDGLQNDEDDEDDDEGESSNEDGENISLNNNGDDRDDSAGSDSFSAMMMMGNSSYSYGSPNRSIHDMGELANSPLQSTTPTFSGSGGAASTANTNASASNIGNVNRNSNAYRDNRLRTNGARSSRNSNRSGRNNRRTVIDHAITPPENINDDDYYLYQQQLGALGNSNNISNNADNSEYEDEDEEDEDEEDELMNE